MPITLNGTTGIVGPDGSAASPAIQGSDANTGMFFPAADTIAFAEGGAEVMRIDSSGNVGIGTSSPAERLDVSSTAGNTRVQIYETSSSGNSQAIARLRTSGTGPGYWDIGTGNNASGLNGALRFFDNTAAAERARIDSSGNLLVGTTSTTPNPGAYISPIGAISQGNSAGGSGFEFLSFRRSGVQIGTVTQNGTTAVAYNTTSDYRLKENVAPMTGALARVAALKPVTYTWKSAPDENGEGFIAHELAEVCPQAVTGEKDAVNEDGSIKAQSIDTSFLVATLTAAIQEQQAMIVALKAEVDALKAQLGAQA